VLVISKINVLTWNEKHLFSTGVLTTYHHGEEPFMRS